MRNIILVVMFLLVLDSTWAVSFPTKKAYKFVHTRIVQASKDTALTYKGVQVFVPAGQAIILGQTEQGSIIVRGRDLAGVKIGEGTILARGPVILFVDPQTNVIDVSRGEEVYVTDSQGRTAALSQGAFVSMKDIRISTARAAVQTSPTPAKPNATVATPAVKSAKTQATAWPSFIADTIIENTATEQAAQDVEETLSPSAPR